MSRHERAKSRLIFLDGKLFCLFLLIVVLLWGVVSYVFGREIAR